MKIAIYSGVIPSTTFIEDLIKGLAVDHRIYLYGVSQKKVKYGNPNIVVTPLYESRLKLLFTSLYWKYKLAFLCVHRYRKLKKHIHTIENNQLERLRDWSKYGPAVFHNPDIFHVQWSKATSEWLFLKTLFGIKLAVSFRGSQMNFSQITDLDLDEAYREVLPLYDLFHAVSHDVLNNAMEYNIDISKSMVIHPAIRTEMLKRFRIKKREAGPLRILTVGRSNWIKGIDVAIDAAKILDNEDVDFYYTIVAGGNQEELIYHKNQLGLEKKIKLLSTIKHEEAMELYNTADLLILPSHAEGIANVLLEAMAVGVPVISTLCGGVTELIEDGVNGWLVPIRNPKALAQKIKEFASLGDDEVEKVVRNGYDTVRKGFLQTAQIEEFNKFYRLMNSI